MTTFYDVLSEVMQEPQGPIYPPDNYVEARMVDGNGVIQRLYEWECKGSEITVCESNTEL